MGYRKVGNRWVIVSDERARRLAEFRNSPQYWWDKVFGGHLDAQLAAAAEQQQETPSMNLQEALRHWDDERQKAYAEVRKWRGDHAKAYPAEYVAAELAKAEANARTMEQDAANDIQKLGLKAQEAPLRAAQTGAALTPAQLQEASLIVEQYKAKQTRQERQQVATEARTALSRGDVDRARVYARAAEALEVNDGELSKAMAEADPARQRGRLAAAGVAEAVELWQVSDIRDRAAAGMADQREALGAKQWAWDHGYKDVGEGSSLVASAFPEA